MESENGLNGAVETGVRTGLKGRGVGRPGVRRRESRMAERLLGRFGIGTTRVMDSFWGLYRSRAVRCNYTGCSLL